MSGEGNGKPEGKKPETAGETGLHNERLQLVAYPISPIDMPLVPAWVNRPWIDGTASHFAKRCLPLLMANQAGWLLISGHRLTATWDGGAGAAAVSIRHLEGEPPYAAHSHFGSGILTFTVPFLFRTPKGFNLQVRGPSNFIKDGIAPIEGIVETDWAAATFTINWKFTRPNHTIQFDRGEPIAMLVPQRRGELERFDPVVRDIATNPRLMESYVEWMTSRERFNAELRIPGTDASRQGWQKDYFMGRRVGGDPAAAPPNEASDHQQKLKLKPFVDEQALPPAGSSGP